MKSYSFYYILSILLLFCWACDDELDLEPQQSISPEAALSTESDVAAILVGAYSEIGETQSYGGNFQISVDLMGATNQINWNGTFLTLRQMFDKQLFADNGAVAGIWNNSFETINQTNIVLDNIGAITSSTEEKNRIEGEAKFLRALNYLALVQNFALPYEAGQMNSQPGVPIRSESLLNFSGDLSIARSSVEEVYNFIISDLTDAYNLLPTENSFYADRYAAQAILARIYLLQGKYPQARDAANDVIENSGHVLAEDYAAVFNNDSDGPEDLFAMQVTSQDGAKNDLVVHYASEGNGGRGGDISISNTFLERFDPADIRGSFTYESPENGELLTRKYTNENANVTLARLTEMYLIRAESNFVENTSIGASPQEDINTIRARVSAPALSDITLEDIWNERELELAFEGFLLYDLQRTKQNIGEFAYNAPELVMPIPQSELDANSIIQQNPGY